MKLVSHFPCHRLRGVLLPSNVLVREEADSSLVVGFMDPVAVMQMTSNTEVGRVEIGRASCRERV